MQEKDLYLSIGPKCRPIHYLRDHHLTWFANPLDWQSLYSLDTIIHLFQDGFKDFFAEVQELEAEENAPFRSVYDVKNDIKSLHQFPKEISLQAGRTYVSNRAKIRFRNTEAAINEADSILLLGNWKVQTEELAGFLLEFAKRYPEKSFELHNVYDMPDQTEIEKKETQVSSKLKIVEYFFDDGGNDSETGWLGNKTFWNKIVGQFCLSAESQKRRNEVCSKF